MLEIAFKTQHPKVVVMETGPLFRVRGKSEEIKSTLSEMGNRYFSRSFAIMMSGRPCSLAKSMQNRILRAIWCAGQRSLIPMAILI